MSWARAAMVVVSAVMVGCNGDPSVSGSDDPPMSATASPSTAASASGASGVAELAPSLLPLDPGRYTSSEFEPAITIELDGTWRTGHLAAGFFDVQRGDPGPDVIAVQFGRPFGVYGASGSTEPATAAEAVDVLGTNPALEVVETSASRIGGLNGSQVTVENGGAGRAEIMQVGPGTLTIDPGRRLWVAFFEMDDGLLAIMVGGAAASWDEALAAAEPVLESVEIAP
jgi:hypothetical protein